MGKKPPPPRYPKQRRARRQVNPWLIAAAVGAVAAIAAAFALASRSSKSSTVDRALPGAAAPAFEEADVVTNRPVRSADLRGRKVLLFFSEGVMCQPCFQQIQALEARRSELARRGLVLVSITTDPPSILRQAASVYGIETPLVSDEDRDMSRAYDVLGQGMHPDTAGHTFVLVDAKGEIRWRRDYTTMYVPPEELLAAIPRL